MAARAGGRFFDGCWAMGRVAAGAVGRELPMGSFCFVVMAGRATGNDLRTAVWIVTGSAGLMARGSRLMLVFMTVLALLNELRAMCIVTARACRVPGIH